MVGVGSIVLVSVCFFCSCCGDWPLVLDCVVEYFFYIVGCYMVVVVPKTLYDDFGALENMLN